MGGLELALLQEGGHKLYPLSMLVGTEPCQGFLSCSHLASWVQPHGYIHALQTFLLSPLAEKFLQNQHLSYGQPLTLLLGAEGNGTGTESRVPLLRVQLVLEGEGMEVTIPSSESQPRDGKQAVTFRYLSWCSGNSRVIGDTRGSCQGYLVLGVQLRSQAPWGFHRVPHQWGS